MGPTPHDAASAGDARPPGAAPTGRPARGVTRSARAAIVAALVLALGTLLPWWSGPGMSTGIGARGTALLALAAATGVALAAAAVLRGFDPLTVLGLLGVLALGAVLVVAHGLLGALTTPDDGVSWALGLPIALVGALGALGAALAGIRAAAPGRSG